MFNYYLSNRYYTHYYCHYAYRLPYPYTSIFYTHPIHVLYLLNSYKIVWLKLYSIIWTGYVRFFEQAMPGSFFIYLRTVILSLSVAANTTRRKEPSWGRPLGHKLYQANEEKLCLRPNITLLFIINSCCMYFWCLNQLIGIPDYLNLNTPLEPVKAFFAKYYIWFDFRWNRDSHFICFFCLRYASYY